MKKHKSYIILWVTLLFCGIANAEVKHYIGAQVNAGEWSLWAPEGPTGNDLSYGAAGAVGFVYEMQVGPKYGETFFLLNLGLSAKVGTTNFRANKAFDYPLENQTDADGQQFTYIYSLTDRQDRYNKLVAQIPILIGVQHKRFYFLAGAKVGYNALCTYMSQGNLTTYGVYTDIDPIYNAPEQQFFATPQFKSKDGKCQVNPFSVDVTAEMGGRLGDIITGTGYDVPKRTMEMRLAVFADYGIFGLNKWGLNKGALMINKSTSYSASNDMIGAVQMNDVLSSKDYIPSNVKHGVKEGDFIGHNMSIGLKFTILFLQPEKGKCVLCHDNYLAPKPSVPTRRVHYEE